MIQLRRILVGLLAMAGAIQGLIVFTPLTCWWTDWLARPWHEADRGTLVVLAGSEVAPGLLGYSSYWRSVAAVRAWRSGSFNSILLTGTESTTSSMEAFLRAHEIPAAAITREGNSVSTRESVLNSRPLVRERGGAVTLLTSDYHIRRAVSAFEKEGVRVKTRPAPDAGKRARDWTQRWGVATELSEETMKLLYYWWRGWI